MLNKASLIRRISVKRSRSGTTRSAASSRTSTAVEWARWMLRSMCSIPMPRDTTSVGPARTSGIAAKGTCSSNASADRAPRATASQPLATSSATASTASSGMAAVMVAAIEAPSSTAQPAGPGPSSSASMRARSGSTESPGTSRGVVGSSSANQGRFTCHHLVPVRGSLVRDRQEPLGCPGFRGCTTATAPAAGALAMPRERGRSSGSDVGASV